MYKYLIIFFILTLIYKLNNVENFQNIYLPNYSKLNVDNDIRIIIDNIIFIFEKNNFFSSKFKCDQLLLLLDTIIEDYNSFLSKACSLKNIQKYSNQSELDNMKQDLKQYIINEIDFISKNYKNILEIEITKFIDLTFNEYIFNCS
jgi:hypothetical protein